MNTKEQPAISVPLESLVATHLIGAIRFGTITIRFQDWKPTHVERNEITRLREEEGDKPEQG